MTTRVDGLPFFLFSLPLMAFVPVTLTPDNQEVFLRNLKAVHFFINIDYIIL